MGSGPDACISSIAERWLETTLPGEPHLWAPSSTTFQLPIDSLTLQTVVRAVESGPADGPGLDEEINRDIEH